MPERSPPQTPTLSLSPVPDGTARDIRDIEREGQAGHGEGEAGGEDKTRFRFRTGTRSPGDSEHESTAEGMTQNRRSPRNEDYNVEPGALHSCLSVSKFTILVNVIC